VLFQFHVTDFGKEEVAAGLVATEGFGRSAVDYFKAAPQIASFRLVPAAARELSPLHGAPTA
jgi:hypothetical protein